MARITSFILTAFALLAQTALAEDFAVVGRVVEAVTKEYFASRPPEKPFSIATRLRDEEGVTFKPIDPVSERTILAGLGEAAKHFVPVSDLRFPARVNGKLVPGGIESAKTGESVYVFYVSHTEYVDAQTLRVHYASYHANLAASGGHYIVRFKRNGFEITKGKGHWVL